MSKQIWAFLVLAFALSWITWFTALKFGMVASASSRACRSSVKRSGGVQVLMSSTYHGFSLLVPWWAFLRVKF